MRAIIFHIKEKMRKRRPAIKKRDENHAGRNRSLATFGYASVPVVRKPVVGIIATGTELLHVSDPLEPGKSATATRDGVCPGH